MRYSLSASTRCLLSGTYRVLIWLAVAGPLVAAAQDEVGVKVPDGFEVSIYADDDLAHDIYSMTIDAQGRVVVSGAGYVRILIDEDGDGRADSFKQFADGPKTGAQGMYFLDGDLICTGDAGLIRYRDRDGDGRADGKPDLFLRMKTGGEHHVHSVQKGPDGWWYLVAGNYAGVSSAYANLPTSPIREPHAGVIYRLKPNMAGGEIVADGYRNAYDFTFHGSGDLFLYDSDGERDVSLPWYRPTRVFQALPASNAGWISRSWKSPDDFADMPPVIGAFGRGSPTGVTCYRHTAFPPKYHDALFVLDWTFGRVIALPLERTGSTWKSDSETFMTGLGQFGFAPTDVEVGPDGSLFVCVGGRGTRGRVYRVTHAESRHVAASPPRSLAERLEFCLRAPQPCSSWSRARWQPLARDLGEAMFKKVAVNDSLSASSRIRAIEILTELFAGLDDELLRTLARSNSPLVRARAVWSIGRTRLDEVKPDQLLPYLQDDDPLVTRCALETLLCGTDKTDYITLLPEIAALLANDDRYVRQSAARVVARLPETAAAQLKPRAQQAGPRAILCFDLGRNLRGRAVDPQALETGMQILQANYPASLKLEAARLMQLALGDVGPREGRDPVFDGYAEQVDFQAQERDLDSFRSRLANLFPSPDQRVNSELARLLAMLGPYNRALLDRVLNQINSASHPVDDIHYLIVASRIPVDRSSAESAATAKALVAIDEKISSRELNQDNNWGDRMGELYRALVKHDPALPVEIVRAPGFGRPGHVLFLSELPARFLSRAVDAFVRKIEADPDYLWSNDVLFVLGESDKPEHLEMVRSQYENFAVRSAILMILAESPQEQDRQKFLDGLISSQLEVLEACLSALAKLPKSDEAAEQVTLVKTLRRLGENPQEYRLREKVVDLLRRNTGENFGFVPGKLGNEPQKPVVDKWTIWVHRKYPRQAALGFGGDDSELEELKTLLADVAWETGDATRGEALYRKRSCAQCHSGRRTLGPDLAGAARRFSRNDLLTAIAAPNRDVSPRYQTTLIQTDDGKVYTGLIVYESVDGLILRNSTNQTFRIEADEIEQRRVLSSSLMPRGLLKDLQPQDLADLYAYLRTLGGEKPQSASQDDSQRQ